MVLYIILNPLSTTELFTSCNIPIHKLSYQYTNKAFPVNIESFYIKYIIKDGIIKDYKRKISSLNISM